MRKIVVETGFFNLVIITDHLTEAPFMITCSWFGLVSLFDGISTFVGYLMPKPFS